MSIIKLQLNKLLANLQSENKLLVQYSLYVIRHIFKDKIRKHLTPLKYYKHFSVKSPFVKTYSQNLLKVSPTIQNLTI